MIISFALRVFTAERLRVDSKSLQEKGEAMEGEQDVSIVLCQQFAAFR